MNARETLLLYASYNFRVVSWPSVGDQKGPTEQGWPKKLVTADNYVDGHRVGILTGYPIDEHKYLHDVDIDWAPGALIAAAMLPRTDFVYGRKSKPISHCFFTLDETLPRITYADPVDGVTLLEIRGTKNDGDVGWQSMAPPSIWSNKTGQTEPLEFRAHGRPTHAGASKPFVQRVTLGAVGMLLAKRLGHNGFGHEPRLMWAGFLLRAGILPEDLIAMGEAMSAYCNNREVVDVRQVVNSTAAALQQDAKKVKGGPALAKLLGADGKKVIAEINKWLGRDSDFARDSDGVIIKDHQGNIRKALEVLGFELSYNEFSEQMMVTEREKLPRPLDDRMLNTIWLRIDSDCRFRPSFQFYERVVMDVAYDSPFHPVKQYLSSLVWDKTPRINHWLATYGGAEETAENSDTQTYLEAISSIVLIAAVRRIMHPGCKYDEMLVLESEQGFNKSTALKALCPDESWFSDDLPLNVESKQVIEATLGKWIIEASDLAGWKKADRDHLKSMLSRQVDGPARMAYAHMPVERKRQFIIVGTTNNREYLLDSTGNRRFWPSEVRRFDIEALKRDRDQLWAEAVMREAANESTRLSENLWGVASEHQERRRALDAWEEIIEGVVESTGTTNGAVRIATDTIWTALGIETAKRDNFSGRRIADVMQKLGFTRGRVKLDGKTHVGYVKAMSATELEEHYAPQRVAGGETPF
jgi:predicted P-loop ATPase